MQTIFEKMGITYRQEGDCLLANLEPPESPKIGFLGTAAASISANEQRSSIHDHADERHIERSP